jgi:hypothetical protein
MRDPLQYKQWLFLFSAVAGLFTSVTDAASLRAPFEATLYFTEQVVPTGTAPCALIGAISGTGVATKIGPVHIASTDCINPLPATYTTFAFSSHQVVLTTYRPALGDVFRHPLGRRRNHG